MQSIKNGSTYVGFTENPEKRPAEHNAGKTRSIKHKAPFKLVYKEPYENKTEAIRRETRLKKDSWEKEQLFRKIFPE